MGYPKKLRETMRRDREKLSKEVEKGKAPADVDRANSCSLSKVIHACHEFNVETPHNRATVNNTEVLRILHKLLYTDTPLALIASECRCTLWRVNYTQKIAKA